MVLRFRPGLETLPTAPDRMGCAQSWSASGRARAFALAAWCATGLAGCGSPQLASYDLASARVGGLRANAVRGVLAVNIPHADSSLDTDRILIREGGDRLAYLAGAKWADSLPGLLQSRLIGTFENARQLKAVGRPGKSSDYSLSTDIRKFEVDVTTGEARVELVARIFSDQTGRPLAAKIFSASAPAPSTAGGAAARALDEALGDVLRRIVLWTVSTV